MGSTPKTGLLAHQKYQSATLKSPPRHPGPGSLGSSPHRRTGSTTMGASPRVYVAGSPRQASLRALRLIAKPVAAGDSESSSSSDSDDEDARRRRGLIRVNSVQPSNHGSVAASGVPSAVGSRAQSRRGSATGVNILEEHEDLHAANASGNEPDEHSSSSSSSDEEGEILHRWSAMVARDRDTAERNFVRAKAGLPAVELSTSVDSVRGAHLPPRVESLPMDITIVPGSLHAHKGAGNSFIDSAASSFANTEPAVPASLDIPTTPQYVAGSEGATVAASYGSVNENVGSVPLSSSSRRRHLRAKSSMRHEAGRLSRSASMQRRRRSSPATATFPEEEILPAEELGEDTLADGEHFHHRRHRKRSDAAPGERGLFGVPWRTVARRIPYYIPVLSWLPRYPWREDLIWDLFAGLTLGILLVPQGLTYAALANLPPVFGLYTAFFPLIVYTLLGSSKHLSVGPEVTSSILIGKAILQFPNIPSGEITDPAVSAALIEAALALTFTIGVVSLVLGLTRLGFLDSILSRPMLSGFVTAVALTLICEQMPVLLGMATACGTSCKPGTSPAEIAIYVFGHFEQTHWRTLVVSLTCCLFMFGVQAVKSRYPQHRALVCFPDVLVVVVVATLVSYLADLSSKGVTVFGHLETGFRTPEFPKLEHVDFSQLITSAVTISLLGFVESQLISKRYASKHAYIISANRELVALGSASFLGSMFGAYTAFGSIPRTKVAESAGVRSQLGNLVAASVVLTVILWLLPHFSFMPRAASASIILVVAVSLFDAEELLFVIRTRQWKDLCLMFSMFLVTFLLGVDVGIAFAFGCCLLLAVKQTTLPLVTMLGRGSADDDFHDVSDLDEDVAQVEGLLIYKLEGALFFANAEKLKDSTKRAETQGAFHIHPSEEPQPMAITAVLFELSALTTVDASALMILHEILESYVARGVRVCFIKLRKPLRPTFEAAGLIELIGRHNLFKKLEKAVADVQRDNLNNLAHDAELEPEPADGEQQDAQPLLPQDEAAAAPATGAAAADLSTSVNSNAADGVGVGGSVAATPRSLGLHAGAPPSTRRKKSSFFAPPTVGSPLLRNLTKLKI